MPSFDVVSKLDLQELDNAIIQTRKEVQSRYDFQGMSPEVGLAEDKVTLNIKAKTEDRLKTLYEMLLGKLSKRGVSLRGMETTKPVPSGLNTVKMTLKLQQGVPVEKSKDLIKMIKDSKLKVQASIQADQLRVTGKNRDDLQAAMALLRQKQDEVGVDMQFTNFRE